MMNKSLTLAAASLFVLAALGSVTAYHIEGTPAFNLDVNGNTVTISSADWQVLVPGLVICESDGDRDFDAASGSAVPNGDVDSDDRLGFGTDGEPGRPGVGGLCTTGESYATGTAPLTDADYAGLLMNKRNYIRIDACDALTFSRAGSATAPYDEPADQVGQCEDGISLSGNATQINGRTNAHGWSAEVGAFSCFVPTAGDPQLAPADDFALYYNRLYAFWSYDGDGWYSADGESGDVSFTSPGATASGSDGASPNDNDGSPSANNFTDNERANHGHVTMFIQPTRSEVGASTQGSAETTGPELDTVWPFSGNLSDMPRFGLGGNGNYGNNCGASPSCPPTSPAVYAPPANDYDRESCDTDDASDDGVAGVGFYGPVIRAPYHGHNATVPPLPPTPPPIGPCDTAQNGTSNQWLASATAVAKLNLDENTSAIVEAGGVVLTPDAPDLIYDLGGTWVPSGSCAVNVTATNLGLLGTTQNMAFQACLDLNNDSVCSDPPGPRGGDPCEDVVLYNHQDGGALVNPMSLSLVGISGDPPNTGCAGADNDWVIFICTGVHSDGTGAHTHPGGVNDANLEGTATSENTGTDGFEDFEGGFCGGLVLVTTSLTGPVGLVSNKPYLDLR